MPIQTCFESEQELLLFQKLCGTTPKFPAIRFDSWLRTHYPNLLTEEERLAIARAFTRSKLPAEHWLPTIELLRGSLVLNKEQAIFCFDQLPKTAKNKALRDCFFFYLESRLNEDSMSQVWDLIGSLKSQKHSLPFLKSTAFVPATFSSYLFRELADATRYLSAESQVSSQHFNQLFGVIPPSQEINAQQGSRLQSLEALAQAIHLYLSEHSTQSVLISFLGTPQSKDFLRFRLASLGHSSTDWTLSEQKTEKSPHTMLVRRIREDSSLNIHEKLSLNSVLNSHRPYLSESLPSYLDRLLTQQLIDEKQKEILGNLKDLPSLTPEQTSKPIYFVPWMRLPTLPGFGQFAFCDESLKDYSCSSCLFSENELDTLFFAGFHLPRKSETLKIRLDILKYHAIHWPSHTYTALPTEDLTDLPHTVIRTFLTRSRPALTSPKAELPIARLSATQLETYANCPSKYLFRRLKLKEPSLPLSDFALQLGQAVHKTLETLLSHASTTVLDETVLRDTFSSSLKETLPAREYCTSRRLFYLKAFEKFIPRILENEATLKSFFGTKKTLAAEKEFSVTLKGIPVIGKIDRVDLLENGHLLILDYKTGSVDFTPDHLAQGTNFQALLYWLGAQEAFNLFPAAMLFYDLKKGEVKRGLAREESLSPEAKKILTRGHTLKTEKLDSLISSGLNQLDAIANSIRAGDFSPKPSLEACKFCEAPAFCRRGHGYV